MISVRSLGVMIMSSVKLFVATNNPQKAAIDLFLCDLELVPTWAKIVHDVADLAAIPTDSRVINQWYGQGSLFEQIWREERQHRSFNMDYAAHIARLQAWHTKRWADSVDVSAPAPGPSDVVQFPNSFTPQSTRPERKQPRWS